MPKRKFSSLAGKKKITSIQKKQKQGVLTPQKATTDKEAEAERQLNVSRRETPGRAAKRKTSDMITKIIGNREEAAKDSTIGTSATIQPEGNISKEKSPTRSSRIIIKHPNENKMVLRLNRIETNIVETLRLHGVTLPDHDLQLLNRLQKSNQNNEQSNIKTVTSIDLEPKGPAILPVVSPILEQVNVVQLTEVSAQVQEKSTNEANSLNSQMNIAASVPSAVTHVILHTNMSECKNNFLENLALTQIVPTRTYSNPSNTKKTIKITLAKRDSISSQKNIESPMIEPSVPNGITATTTAPISAPSTNALSNLSNKTTQGNTRLVSNVKIISLPPEDLQNLQNNKLHIQYLASKKDPCPQEVSLLSKLRLIQTKILSTGKPVKPIRGQRVQGIPFSTDAFMYIVQNGTHQSVTDTRKTTKKVVASVPTTELTSPATTENRSNSSINIPQVKNSVVGKLLELATSNNCDYILPDAEKTVCNRNSCILQIARLKSELNQKSIALESCNSELANLRAELNKANEYVSNLRAQLEENTHTLCSYLAASSHINYE
ncbi:uncharacterized protein LOC130690543 [Daphnia carinata]|uniref:uncharacterized protein LOC130690543 n=1 Tax=Daphnia carinata TaxID=120202 RepID=UPI00257D7D58|nr:uncharacterized protein LOC130690543 [Daphnia carinata]XP_057369538.1 uncharacterized protein LOC130690543 [Daphnia carinata]XP_057369539.1 uncharacterized protein LOC130690543 [Daphnia carinata]